MGKRLLIATILTLLLLLVGWVVQEKGFNRHAAVPSGATSPTPRPDRVIARSVEGSVEKQGQNADWAPLQAGDELSLEDSIRTHDGGAVIDMGDAVTVRIAPDSQVSVGEVSKETTRMRLDEGHVTAEVRGGGASKLELKFKDSDATATSSEGAFTALASGDGEVRVAAQKGAVRLSAKNSEVVVAEGQQSVVEHDLPPSAPQQVQASLFLKLGKPRALVQKETQTVVTGEATPDAWVSVNGVRTKVGKDGHFTTKVKLKEGANDIKVEARDVTGAREKQTLPTITVDTKPLNVDGKVKWK